MENKKNKHGPGCNCCVHEESRIIGAGFCGYNRHKYCSNKNPCNGFKINPPEYREQKISCTYRGSKFLKKPGSPHGRQAAPGRGKGAHI
jgi:hypothetical protein